MTVQAVMASGVVADALVKEFPGRQGASVRALDHVSFEAPPGIVTGLVGPDGAGKTTLIRLAAGLLVPDGGRVRVLGLDPVVDTHQLHKRIGYMPQKFGLYEDLSVQENIDLYADLQGVPHPARPGRFERLMKLTGLAPFLGRLAGRLSGGMKQKLGLACALIKSPDLLLLDEPTVGVDPVSRRELWRIIDELVDEQGIGVLVATSYLDEAARCSRVILLDGGELLATGPPADFPLALGGRVWELRPAPGCLPRGVQTALASAPTVLDATVRSGRVRVVTTEPVTDPGARFAVTGIETSTPVEPDFADAFMARLAARRERVAMSALVDMGGRRPEGGEIAVRVRDLRKRFGDFEAVRGVSFEVREGEIFGLLGPNGAGKSTTFRMLCGLSSISGGEAMVAGRDLRRAGKRARARIGYMAQKFSLYDSLSVAENLRFFGIAYGLSGARLRSRIDESLHEFGLLERRGTTAGLLPGGFKQRLAMAAAVLHDPDILFLDEPTSGVDPIARREFWRRINALALAGTTIVITTHFMEEAEYCDRLLIMTRGATLAMGTPEEIRALAHSAASPEPTIEDAFIALAEGRQEEAT